MFVCKRGKAWRNGRALLGGWGWCMGHERWGGQHYERGVGQGGTRGMALWGLGRMQDFQCFYASMYKSTQVVVYLSIQQVKQLPTNCLSVCQSAVKQSWLKTTLLTSTSPILFFLFYLLSVPVASHPLLESSSLPLPHPSFTAPTAPDPSETASPPLYYSTRENTARCDSTPTRRRHAGCSPSGTPRCSAGSPRRRG